MPQPPAVSPGHRLAGAAILILTCLFSVQAGAEPKAWETERETIWNHGPIQVRMHKDFARNAEPNSFQADYAQMNYPVTAIFRGPCSEFITLQVSIGDQRKVDVKDHIESGRGADLPIRDYLEAAVDSLTEQCPQIQVIRVEVTPVYPQQGRFDYKGTMVRENGWRLQDGIVKTAYDHAHTIEIKFRDMMSTLGVNYKGPCVESPVIELAPMYANRQEAALAKPPSITDFMLMAKGVAQRYAQQCPETAEVRFTIQPMPEEFECKDAENCHIVARKDNDWEADRSALAFKAAEPDPIPDLGAMIDVLAREDYGLLKDYQNFFAFYYENFLNLYSIHCRSHIRNPRVMEIQTVEVSSDGFFSNAEPVGPPRQIYLDPDYVDTWERYYQAWKPWAVNRYISSVLKNQQRGRGPVESSRWAMGYFTRNINALEDRIRGNCQDETVQAAYRNMLSYAKMPNKPLNPRTRQMTEEFQSMTDLVAEGLGLVQDAYSEKPSAVTGRTGNSQTSPPVAETAAAAPAPPPPPAEQPTGPTAGMVGAWSGEIEGKKVELALWPQPGKPEMLEGFAFIPEHDCLTQAGVFIYEDKISFNFNSSGATTREGNCQKDLGGMPSRFQTDGWIAAESEDLLTADLPFLIMGKPVKTDGNGNGPHVPFKRAPASAEFKQILGTFDHPYRQEPSTEFINSI